MDDANGAVALREALIAEVAKFIANQRAAVDSITQLTEKVKTLEERVHNLEDESRARESRHKMADCKMNW